MNAFGPNPPFRREEDFPKTTTIPEGWSTDSIHHSSHDKDESASENCCRPTPIVEDESLFQRGLDPFPKPNTIPNGWDLSSL
jgi:hypothetical protein